MQHHDHSEHHIVPYGTHIKVWVVLLVLTAVTVGLAGKIPPPWGGVFAFVVASTKASFVLAVFMHLKYEVKMFRLMAGVALVTLVIIFALTFGDYLYR